MATDSCSASRTATQQARRGNFDCHGCGETFPKSANNQKYCATCKREKKRGWAITSRKRANRKNGKPFKGDDCTCIECGSVFAARQGLNLYCSRDCTRVVEHRKRRERRRKDAVGRQPGTEFPCDRCGERVVATGPAHKYCEPCRGIRRAETIGEWREQNPDKVREMQRNVDQRREGTPGRRAQNRVYSKARREKKKDDPRWKLDRRISEGIRGSLKGMKAGRTWESLVGYSLESLFVHLEDQFCDGMSWDNMGDWYVDHIIPKSHFKYIYPEDEEFGKCWSLDNLQPLWAEDNLRKSNKLDFVF